MADDKGNTENTPETAVSATAGSPTPIAPAETASIAIPVEQESGPVNGGGGNLTESA